MQNKYLLDLKALEEQVKASKLRYAATLGFKAFQGSTGGLGTGSLVLSITTAVLSVFGITAAAVLETIAAGAAAGIFGIVALIVSVYQIRKDSKKIQESNKDFKDEVNKVRKVIIDLLKNYELLNKKILELDEEIASLNKALIEEADKLEIEEKLRQLKQYRADFEAAQEDLILHLKVSLSIVAGKTYADKLSNLFEQPDATASSGISNYAFNLEFAKKLSQDDTEQVERALKAFQDKKVFESTQDEIEDNSQYKSYSKDLAPLIEAKRDKTHRSIKRITYALTVIGGFGSGFGLVVGIGGLVMGGAATFLAIGWPVIVPALLAGVLIAAAAFFYLRRIEKKQAKTHKALNIATTQVKGMTTYIDKVNENVNEQIKGLNASRNVDKVKMETLFKHEAKVLNKCNSNLKEYNASFEEVLEKLKASSRAKLIFNKNDSDKVSALFIDIKKNLDLLKMTEEMVKEIAIIIPSQQEEKNRLLLDINKAIKENQKSLDEVHHVKTEIEQIILSQTQQIQKKEIDTISINSTLEANENLLKLCVAKMESHRDFTHSKTVEFEKFKTYSEIPYQEVEKLVKEIKGNNYSLELLEQQVMQVAVNNEECKKRQLKLVEQIKSAIVDNGRNLSDASNLKNQMKQHKPVKHTYDHGFVGNNEIEGKKQLVQNNLKTDKPEVFQGKSVLPVIDEVAKKREDNDRDHPSNSHL